MRFGSGKRLACVLVFAALAACGDDELSPFVAHPVEVRTLEEEPVSGHLEVTGPAGGSVGFLVEDAEHGRLTATRDGSFTFEPDPDYFGITGFNYVAIDGRGRWAEARVTLIVENVNDPPRIVAIPDLHNSPESEVVEYRLTVLDPDPDDHTLSVTVASPDVAEVDVDEQSSRLLIKSLQVGKTRIDVVASDAEFSDGTAFEFVADEVIKERRINVAPTETSGITIRNHASDPVDFVLQHNGFSVFENEEDVIEHVRALPPEQPGEPFERKLWRFLVDTTRHYYPLMPQQFAHAPWATLNSLGFGFCADVASTYVMLARAAGYEARIWSIGGHVVPEIRVSGRWEVYDPDLAVYYLDQNGRVAGVAQLAANPALVSNPVSPILPPGSWPYSTIVANIYGTPADNLVGDDVLLPSVTDMLGRFHLPAGAVLTYPGRWTEPPIAHEVFGVRIMNESALRNWRAVAQQHGLTATYPVPFHKQAKLDLPHGWTGELPLPLWLWDVLGTGDVELDGITYSIGSDSLRERLRYRLAPRSIRILSGNDVQLIMQINFVQFALDERNDVALRGLNVWALGVEETTLGERYAGDVWPYARGEP